MSYVTLEEALTHHQYSLLQLYSSPAVSRLTNFHLVALISHHGAFIVLSEHFGDVINITIGNALRSSSSILRSALLLLFIHLDSIYDFFYGSF